eukprot:TRINITY_DN3033_c0_g1_i1.p1 TRINITY_DN3033_c0_g1~~TRINITY_DN3033_c0_g1_i1.p1  ORF type:complete len:236 (-),score=56.46 TRINITY_DN3033_c0_g1_i1:354-1061(-)
MNYPQQQQQQLLEHEYLQMGMIAAHQIQSQDSSQLALSTTSLSPSKMGLVASAPTSERQHQQNASKRNSTDQGDDSSDDDDEDSKDGGNQSDKKMRRLLKNRESAHMSRIRKKNYINELEKRTTELSSSNSDLQTRVNTLATENKLLKDQLAYLRLVLSQAATTTYQPTPQIPMMQGQNPPNLGANLPSTFPIQNYGSLGYGSAAQNAFQGFEALGMSNGAMQPPGLQKTLGPRQ